MSPVLGIDGSKKSLWAPRERQQQPKLPGWGSHELSRAGFQSLHMAREITFAMVGRPISFGNSTYIDECMRSLADIRRSLPRDLGDVGPGLTESFDRVLKAPSKKTVTALFTKIDRLGAYRARRGSVRYQPMPAGLLWKRSYRRLIVMAGPGIGVGDEITFGQLLNIFHEHFRCEQFEIYTFYPGVWKTLMPQAETRDLVGRPLAAFKRIEQPVRGSTLILFSNFVGQSMLSGLPHRPDLDAFEVAVGRGSAWLWLGAERRAFFRAEMDLALPSQPRALDRLAACALRGKKRLRSRSQRKVTSFSPQGPFRLVVNPFTSKETPLQPHDWALLIQAIRRALASERSLQCVVYPSLAAETMEFAQEIIRSCRTGGSSDRFLVLQGPGQQPLNAATATPTVFGAIDRADFLLGIDTFTAHLAAFTSTPSLTLCLSRNPEFWEEAHNTFWLDINLGGRPIRAILRWLIMQLTRGQRPEFEAYAKLTRQLFDRRPPRALVGGLLDLLGKPFRSWSEAAATAWNDMPSELRDLLETCDGEFSWPRVARSLDKVKDLTEIQRTLDRYSTSFFHRLAFLGVGKESNS